MTRYFIEHTHTKLWFYPTWIPQFITTFNGSRIRINPKLKPEWTNNPNKESIQYETFEEAKKWILIFGLKDVEVTEHEFYSLN